MNINDNINQFGIYASDIFLHLYDRFPIVLALKSKDIIRPYLDLALDKDIKELQITIDMADLIEVTSGLTEEQKKKIERVEQKHSDIRQSKKSDSNTQEQIYQGTLLFLKEEGFVRETEPGSYQLTAKGFSHLNKEFTNKKITDNEGTYISAIKSVFSGSASSIVSGMAVNIITTMMKSN